VGDQEILRKKSLKRNSEQEVVGIHEEKESTDNRMENEKCRVKMEHTTA
jgi:hypothetical protein